MHGDASVFTSASMRLNPLRRPPRSAPGSRPQDRYGSVGTISVVAPSALALTGHCRMALHVGARRSTTLVFRVPIGVPARRQCRQAPVITMVWLVNAYLSLVVDGRLRTVQRHWRRLRGQAEYFVNNVKSGGKLIYKTSMVALHGVSAWTRFFLFAGVTRMFEKFARGAVVAGISVAALMDGRRGPCGDGARARCRCKGSGAPMRMPGCAGQAPRMRGSAQSLPAWRGTALQRGAR